MSKLLLAVALRNLFKGHGLTFAVKNIVINGDKRGCSGFVSRGDKHVYVNTEPFANLGYMYRTAKSTRDFMGGVNRFVNTPESFVAGILELLEEKTS